MTIKRMDYDKDGRISLSDFVSTVSKDPLMMEAFGNCLPSNSTGLEFMNNILDRTHSF